MNDKSSECTAFIVEEHLAVYEQLGIDEAIDILTAAQHGYPSFEVDLIIKDLKAGINEAVFKNRITRSMGEDIIKIAECDFQVMKELFYPG